MSQQQRRAAHACGGKGSLGAGMATTHHNDVEFGRKLHVGPRGERNDTSMFHVKLWWALAFSYPLASA